MCGTIGRATQQRVDDEAETKRNGSRTTLKARRLLVAGAVFLALMVGGAPVANAGEDTRMQTERFCWLTRC